MSMVAKYMTALVVSTIVTAFGHALVGGLSADLVAQAHFWVISVSLTGLAGLVMGRGIGGVETRSNVVRMVSAPAHQGAIAVAA